MGDDIPRDSPRHCDENCCDDLPFSMKMRITVHDGSSYYGTIVKTNGCEYRGVLSRADPPGNTTGIVKFCLFETNHTQMLSEGPVFLLCGGAVIENNHCSVPVTGLSVGGCTYWAG